MVFPQTKLLYVLSPCKLTKNLLLTLLGMGETSDDGQWKRRNEARRSV